jgi:hypothetical protein
MEEKFNHLDLGPIDEEDSNPMETNFVEKTCYFFLIFSSKNCLRALYY